MNYQDIVKLAEGVKSKKEGALEKDAENILNDAVYDRIVSGSYRNEFKKIAERGQGLGVGGAPQGDLGADKCKCPECGHTMAHIKGTPCQDVACPKCGAKMKGITVKTAEDMEKVSEAEIASAIEKEGGIKDWFGLFKENPGKDRLYSAFNLYEKETGKSRNDMSVADIKNYVKKIPKITKKVAENELEKVSEAEILSAMTYDAIVEAAYEDEMEKIAEMFEKEALGPAGTMIALNAANLVAMGAAGAGAYYLGKKRGKKGKYPSAWGAGLGGPLYTAGERTGLKETHKIVKKSDEDNTDLAQKAEDLTTKIGTYLDTNKEDGQAVLASLIQKNKEKK